MPNVVCAALERFQHPTLMRLQHSPHKWLAPAHRAKVQYSSTALTTPALDKRGITCVQIIASTFLYIVRAIDHTMLVALNEIGSEQALPTTDTIQKTKMLMDYMATQPDAVIQFHASDICLHIDSNAAYLVQPKARSRAAGHFCLSDNPPSDNTRPTPSPNGPVITKCQTIRTVMASAAEAETGEIFINSQQAIPIRTALTNMGHPQPPTPIKTNSASSGIACQRPWSVSGACCRRGCHRRSRCWS